MRPAWMLSVALPAVAFAACAVRERVCMNDCGDGLACVAGRCVSTAPSAKVAVLGDGVTRIVAEPTELAYLRRGDPAGAGTPHIVTLGKDADARLLLRFDLALPSDAQVLEAYLLLSRSDEVDSDPIPPLALHAARIVDPWDARSISWAMQPRLEDVRSPATYATGRSIVRIKVVDLVARWPEHDFRDQGVAVLADTTNATGMAFALAPDTTSFDLDGGHRATGPRLEVYVKMSANASSSSLPIAPDAGANDGGFSDAATFVIPPPASAVRPGGRQKYLP